MAGVQCISIYKLSVQLLQLFDTRVSFDLIRNRSATHDCAAGALGRATSDREVDHPGLALVATMPIELVGGK